MLPSHIPYLAPGCHKIALGKNSAVPSYKKPKHVNANVHVLTLMLSPICPKLILLNEFSR